MKKIFLIAAIAVAGLISVSCSTDTEEMTTTPFKKNETMFSKENKEVYSNEGSVISVENIVGDTIQIEEPVSNNGPGDDVIIITPPKP